MWNFNRKSGFPLIAMMAIGGLVIAGSNAKPLQHAEDVGSNEGTFVVRLLIRRSGLMYGCTGAIIGPRHILTAGHCINGTDAPNGGIIYGGTHNRDDPNAIMSNIAETYKHPLFGTAMGGYDVGIIKVDRPLDLSGRQTLLPLTDREINFNTRGTQFGWSDCQNRNQKTLKRVNVGFLTREDCERRGADDQYPQLLCVDTGSVEVCGGDSGGPIVSNGRVVGIASTGNDLGMPVTAQNVYYYRNWINSIISH